MNSNNKNKINVKLVRRGYSGTNGEWGDQYPGDNADYGDCHFTFDPFDEDYDWLVILDDVPRLLPKWTEILQCSKNNTILVTSEPSSIARYGRAFAKQFKYVITNQSKKYLPHSNAIRSQTGNVWMYGKKYNDLLTDSPNKTKLISTICSNKQQGHTMHKKRFNFTARLEKELPELERFGYGIKWIETKADAIDDYKFHVTIENHVAPHVWTEKLADAFLGYTVPIYCGCTNVFDYFPEDSLIQIDINDVDGSIAKIKEIISKEGEYERRLDAVKEARRRVMEEYNLLAMVDKIIKEDVPNEKKYSGSKIYGRRQMRFKYPPDLICFVWFRISNFLQGCFVRMLSKLKGL